MAGLLGADGRELAEAEAERFYHLKDLWAVGLIKRLGIEL
jgi:hypothetical protein